MFTLPEQSRHIFKEPFGELLPDISDVIHRLAGRRVCSVGDIVTHNLLKNGIVPAVAIIDGQTMRSPCRKRLPVTGRRIRVKNPPGTITDELIAGIRDALNHPPATVDVSGEEDLAVIPLVMEAPDGWIVLYGQPDKGVVVRTVDGDAREQARTLFSRFVRS